MWCLVDTQAWLCVIERFVIVNRNRHWTLKLYIKSTCWMSACVDLLRCRMLWIRWFADLWLRVTTRECIHSFAIYGTRYIKLSLVIAIQHAGPDELHDLNQFNWRGGRKGNTVAYNFQRCSAPCFYISAQGVNAN